MFRIILGEQIKYIFLQTLEIMLNTYNETEDVLYIVNVSTRVMETLKKLLDEKCLSMCSYNDNIELKLSSVAKSEQEIPLLISDFGSRKSSITYTGQRRLSALE